MAEFYPSLHQVTELEVKHSRFITTVAHTPDLNSSEQLIQQIRNQHPKANHNCWARICGSRTELKAWGCSDDGEPKGTAGRPMLNVLEHSEFCELTMVVTRYFGGIKLGTGGLVRAYSQAVQQALQTLEIEERIPTIRFQLILPHDCVGNVEHLIRQLELNIDKRDWQEQLHLTGSGTADQLASLRQQLTPIQHRVDYSDEAAIR